MYRRFSLDRNLAVLCVTIFLNVSARFTWYSLLPLYLRALGANDWEVGISFTVMGIAATLFSVIGGALADRYGRKVLVVLPMCLMSPLFFVAGLSDRWLVIVVMLVIGNIMNALSTPAFSALITESSPGSRVAQGYSYTEFAAILGLVLGPVGGAALLGVLDISKLIVVNAAVLAGTSLLRGWGLYETSRRTVGAPRPNLRTALDPNVRWFIVLATLIFAGFSITFGPYFAILARDAWHNSEAEINLLYAAGSLACVVGISLGRLSDRWGGRRVLLFASLGYGISSIAWGIAPSWQWGLVPLLIAFGFSEAIFIAEQTVQAEITSRETRSSVFGIIATTTGVIGGFGPTLGAWLVTLGGNSMPFVAAGAFSLVAILAGFPIRRVRRTSEMVGAHAE